MCIRDRSNPPFNVDTTAADVNDVSALTEFMTGASVVVHLAGPASVSDSFQNSCEYVRVHTQGTSSVIQVMRQQGIRRLVYVSSAEVYGRPDVSPVSENHRLDARSPYAAAKIGAEKLVEAMCATNQIDACILRPFSIYGYGQSPRSLLSDILEQLTNPSSLEIRLRDLKPVRDYCYVVDLARAVLLAAERQSPGLAICNIGTALGTSVEQLAQTVVEISGRDLRVVESRVQDRPSGSDIYSLIADRSRAKSVLGWEPKVPLRSGLEEMLHEMELPL